MSYSDDVMRSLKYSIDRLNNNIEVIKRLTLAIEKQNELKERELNISETDKEIKIKTLNNNTRKF